MQYRGLRAFCVAAERRSFKAAAEELCVTASAVSHQIRDLEDFLDTRLFDRFARSIELTPEGRGFLSAVGPHLRAIDAAAADLRHARKQTALTLQMPEFFASEMFLPAMTEFSVAHRHIDLRIETTMPHEAASAQADLSVELSRHRPDSTLTRRLFPIDYQPACSPSVRARWPERGLEPAAIKDATLLVHKARPDAWKQWLKAAGAGRVEARQTISVDSMYGLARAAEQGLGLALIPMPVSQQWFRSGKLVPLFDRRLRSEDSYWMTRRSNHRDDEALDVLCEWIVNRFADSDDIYSSVA